MEVYETYWTFDQLSGYSMQNCSNCTKELPFYFDKDSESILDLTIHKYTGEIVQKIIAKCPKCGKNIIYTTESH